MSENKGEMPFLLLSVFHLLASHAVFDGMGFVNEKKYKKIRVFNTQIFPCLSRRRPRPLLLFPKNKKRQRQKSIISSVRA